MADQLSKCLVRYIALAHVEKAIVLQEHADRIAWQLQALEVIELGEYGGWKLTAQGWQELDKLLVEEAEHDGTE